jgi:hypothetical protein
MQYRPKYHNRNIMIRHTTRVGYSNVTHVFGCKTCRLLYTAGTMYRTIQSVTVIICRRFSVKLSFCAPAAMQTIPVMFTSAQPRWYAQDLHSGGAQNIGRNTGNPDILTSFSWFPSVTPGEFRYSTSSRPRQRSAKSFHYHHSSIILQLYAIQFRYQQRRENNHKPQINSGSKAVRIQLTLQLDTRCCLQKWLTSKIYD